MFFLFRCLQIFLDVEYRCLRIGLTHSTFRRFPLTAIEHLCEIRQPSDKLGVTGDHHKRLTGLHSSKLRRRNEAFARYMFIAVDFAFPAFMRKFVKRFPMVRSESDQNIRIGSDRALLTNNPNLSSTWKIRFGLFCVGASVHNKTPPSYDEQKSSASPDFGTDTAGGTENKDKSEPHHRVIRFGLSLSPPDNLGAATCRWCGCS